MCVMYVQEPVRHLKRLSCMGGGQHQRDGRSSENRLFIMCRSGSASSVVDYSFCITFNHVWRWESMVDDYISIWLGVDNTFSSNPFGELAISSMGCDSKANKYCSDKMLL